MARPVAKKEKVGYAVRINRYDQPEGWERVGFLFHTKGEADMWRKAHHPAVKKYSVYAVRVDTRRVQAVSNKAEMGVEANATQ